MYSIASDISLEVNEGLDFILSHFQEPIWPRTISTYATQGRQFEIFNEEEALAGFKQANFLDCKISAYPKNATENTSAIERFQGLTKVTPRNLVVMVDLDKATFKSERALKLALAKTCRNIKNRLGNAIPTIIWSGNGYHIYLVLDSEGINLENIKVSINLTVDQISLKFLRFVEWFLSNDKSDSQHNHSVSFNNCMLRIPGSYNSKCILNGKNPEVKTIQEWDGVRPKITRVLGSFHAYIVDQKIKQEQEMQEWQVKKQRNGSNSDNFNNATTAWIERLIKTPIEDHRKFAVWMILPQYLIKVRRLSYEQASDIINKWLDECDKLRRLDKINTKQKLKEGFKAAEKGFGPIGLNKLKNWKPDLYDIIK